MPVTVAVYWPRLICAPVTVKLIVSPSTILSAVAVGTRFSPLYTNDVGNQLISTSLWVIVTVNSPLVELWFGALTQ